MTPRAEHLEWCKKRALEYLSQGELQNAVTSMGSDMGKHPETGVNAGLLLIGAMYAQEGRTEEVRRWINGFR